METPLQWNPVNVLIPLNGRDLCIWPHTAAKWSNMCKPDAQIFDVFIYKWVKHIINVSFLWVQSFITVRFVLVLNHLIEFPEACHISDLASIPSQFSTNVLKWMLPTAMELQCAAKIDRNYFPLRIYTILQTFVYPRLYSSSLSVNKKKKRFLPHANCSVLQTGPWGPLSSFICTGQRFPSSWSSHTLMHCFLVTVSKLVREQKLGSNLFQCRLCCCMLQ